MVLSYDFILFLVKFVTSSLTFLEGNRPLLVLLPLPLLMPLSLPLFLWMLMLKPLCYLSLYYSSLDVLPIPLPSVLVWCRLLIRHCTTHIIRRQWEYCIIDRNSWHGTYMYWRTRHIYKWWWNTDRNNQANRNLVTGLSSSIWNLLDQINFNRCSI